MKATVEGTRKYSVNFREAGSPESAFRILGRTGLTTSILGFGSYRIDDDTSEHINSLEKALTSGCNLIDTSTNYTDGGSERCVGKVLKSITGRGKFTRDNFVVVSKVGYIQGENLEIAQEQEELGAGYPEMVKYSDGCWHCLHPRFIKAQLERSLQRTGLKTIDVYLLHNPEYFFMDAVHRSKKPVAELRQEFYKRIREAFKCLEECVAEGKIGQYGVSSNTFGSPDEAPDMTSVSEMWKIAEEVGTTHWGDSSRHHFSVIQLPLNLFESDPALEKNANGKTTLEFAKEKNLGVLVNRPLNSFVSEHLVRLAEFPLLETRFPLPDLLKMVSLLENDFLTKFAPEVQADPESLQPEAYFRWGDEIKNMDLKNVSLDQWSQISRDMVIPQVHYILMELDKHFSASENKSWREWRNGYMSAIEELMKAVYNACSRKSQGQSEEVSQKINSLLESNWQSETLSRKSLGVVTHTPGVNCVLVGMRRPEYVEDALGVMNLRPLKNSLELLLHCKEG